MKFHIETFGCTANVGDEMKMRAIFKNSGHELVGGAEEADVVVVNTCTVTKRTELNVLKRLRELEALKALKERGQGKEVVVAGCIAAAQPELVRSVLGENVKMITPRDLFDFEVEVPLEFDGVVAVIPISTGCLGNCSYCIVKRARGELRSRKPEEVCEAVRSAVARGAREIRITSQDCSAYGYDRREGCAGVGSRTRLPELLERVATVEVAGDFRIRVGMMNPFSVARILDDLLEAFDSEKVFKFFHLPVQSGSDKVLGEMRRNYKAADFVEIVKSIRRRFEDCTVCTDFIVGFPTETEADFVASLDLLGAVKPERVNVTRFSPRPGTEAAGLKDLLEREKKRRSRIFSAACRRLALAKNKELEGTVLQVLVTEKGKRGGVVARDALYRTVVVKSEPPPALGATCKVRVAEARSGYLVGEVKV